MSNSAAVEVEVPGSKSHAQRALLVAALARGPSRLRGLPAGQDVAGFVEALRRLDVRITGEAGTGDLVVEGTGGRWAPGKRSIHVGGSATAMRFLAATAALRSGETVLDGDASLQRRSMGSTVDSVKALGVDIRSAAGRAPLYVRGGPAAGGGQEVEVDASSSSQPASALLIAAAGMEDGLCIRLRGAPVSRPYLDLTVSVLREAGVMVHRRGALLRVSGGPPGGRDVDIQRDWSSAAYALLAGVLLAKPVCVPRLPPSSDQADGAVVRLLRAAGGSLSSRGGEVVARRRGALRPFRFDLRDCPDLAPVAAVLGLFAPGESRVEGAAHLREKESDRIQSCVVAVRSLGGEAVAKPDGFVVRGGAPSPGVVDARGDHRIALAFHVAAAALPGAYVEGASCMAKSWPHARERLAAALAPPHGVSLSPLRRRR